MRLLKLSVEGLMLFKEKVEIDFFTEQNVMSDNTEMLFNPFGKIYTNNVISIVGINASGKTSLLKLITFSLNLLNGESINNIVTRDILTESKNVHFEIVFYDDNQGVCKLSTQILPAKENDLEERYVIGEETLYRKKATQIRAKKDMFLFDESDYKVVVRDKSAEFLKDDVSIAISINKNNGFKIRNLIQLTNLNFLRITGNFPRELIQFLDSSINKISFDPNTREIKLEFCDREEISVSNPLQIERYLSSGTIKGINTFLNAMWVFEKGGYLIVDELENHFNREIVATLVRFFMSETVNKKGATLIFSTHYSELLDEFDRNDNIYIVRNRGGITAQKLYKVLKRNDIKKSEAFKSDYLDGTVPSYKSYLNLKKAIMDRVERKG
ncbi:MAG: AAA family ATPase [Peptostreptococcaceae bacterium]|nr:AAA family ATPase [Peptostreptococcaceae bacterium]